MTKNYLITIVGPTAIGKTSLGIRLAEAFKTEIISADSRQFFREMSLGTAAPSTEELSKATHHFIHHKSVEEEYSVGDFEREAIELLDKLFQKKNIVIMVGGSGLYVDAVVKGLDEFPEIDPSVRKLLNQKLEDEGLESLQQELKTRDPEYYSEVDLQNPHRLIRALEVCRGTGDTYSAFRKRSPKKRLFEPLYIGLTAERNIIYERINQRVDLMMQQGLLEEVRHLEEKQDLNALNTVGYKELFKYLRGEWTLEKAIEEIKKNSRRFAKRQLTWFRKNPEIKWFDYTETSERIVEYLQSSMRD